MSSYTSPSTEAFEGELAQLRVVADTAFQLLVALVPLGPTSLGDQAHDARLELSCEMESLEALRATHQLRQPQGF